MKRLLGTAYGLALLCLSCACGEEKVTTGTPAPKRAPAAAAKQAAPERAAHPVRGPIDESEFAESDRSRDPFRSYAQSFVVDASPRGKGQRKVILSEYSIDELKLIGIVTRMQPAKAMLVDPTGKGHVVHRGQFVGRADVVRGADRARSTYEINWRVEHIRDNDVVFVRTDPQNPDVPSATRVVLLRPEGSLVEP